MDLFGMKQTLTMIGHPHSTTMRQYIFPSDLSKIFALHYICAGRAEIFAMDRAAFKSRGSGKIGNVSYQRDAKPHVLIADDACCQTRQHLEIR